MRVRRGSLVVRSACILLASAVFSGCVGGNSAISSDGVATTINWPKWDAVTLNNSRGTFPDPTSLAQVRAGMTKDQLYYLLGRPHYSQGWRQREWNYLFHFYTPGVGKNDITTCQFKVTFDSNSFARNFYWNPVDPADSSCGQKSEVRSQSVRLDADALFAFDRSALGDMNKEGVRKIVALAENLRNVNGVTSIRVEAHTDRLGSASYNERLSQKRAETVRNLLISNGVPSELISAKGYGETRPIKECEDGLSRNELIACLAPNRRVEIIVEGAVAPVQ